MAAGLRHNRRRGGFTMLEAIVALAIVGVVCVGVLGAYGGAIRADVTAADRLPLATLAAERIAAVDLDPGSLQPLPDSLARGTFAPPYASATWETATHHVDQTEGLYELIVRVRDGTDVYTLRTRRYRAPVAGIVGQR
jgi:prepilin-type N-terminal cleavage/methylation domain-containing protein